MNTLLKTILVTGILAGAALWAPSSAIADHNPYWRSHWGWYDNTYTPYYNNYYGPSYYGGYYGPSYGTYYAPRYSGGYYSAPYYSGGYYSPGPSVGVQIGRGRNSVSFGWW